MISFCKLLEEVELIEVCYYTFHPLWSYFVKEKGKVLLPLLNKNMIKLIMCLDNDTADTLKAEFSEFHKFFEESVSNVANFSYFFCWILVLTESYQQKYHFFNIFFQKSNLFVKLTQFVKFWVTNLLFFIRFIIANLLNKSI